MNQVTITIFPEQESNSALIQKLIKNELSKKNLSSDFSKFNLEKKSIDARHGQLKFHLRYSIFYKEEDSSTSAASLLPKWQKATNAKTVVIVGSGPAGLFGALKLLEQGVKPVIIERGEETSDRKKSIAKISTQDFVNSDSNYCFGEGGAGTFSDGKLYTRSNKRGDISKILRIFNHFGANEKILTDAHPHIGTDKLPGVVNNMKDFITAQGGEIHFNCKCVDLICENKKVRGIKTINVKTNETKDFFGDAILLATGHSASDIYEMIAKSAPEALEPKTFAIGMRVEHPRTLIDKIQYHGKTEGMGAAEYRLTTQVQDRGVYSFCMCPGGFVVPSSSGPDEIVVNGMSAAGRNSQWSNAAFVVETRPEDIPETFFEQAKYNGCKALAGLYYRTWLEKEAKRHGKGQAAPAQRLTDFIAERDSKDFPPTSYTPGIVASRLDQWIPSSISGRLAEAFKTFGANMKGFLCKDATMIAIETRTSTPVRITRNKETNECTELKNLYPAGEGAGYAGGIVSSALDGENTCTAILNKLLNTNN